MTQKGRREPGSRFFDLAWTGFRHRARQRPHGRRRCRALFCPHLRVSMAAARGRVASHRFELHVRHVGAPKRGCLSPPRGSLDGDGYNQCLGCPALCFLSIYRAAVPLQRLVPSLDAAAGWRTDGLHPRPRPGKAVPSSYHNSRSNLQNPSAPIH